MGCLRIKTTNQKGFTIIELLIATTIFAVMLLVLSFSLIQISRQYIKSINAGKTQEAARSIVEDISQSIQFGSDAPTIINTAMVPPIQTSTTSESGATATVTAKYFCVGDVRYTFFESQAVGEKVFKKSTNPGQNIVLWKNKIAPGTCTAAAINTALSASDTSRELMPNGMELELLQVEAAGTSGLYKVTVVVALAAGESDINGFGASATCKIRSGSQFCAVSRLTTYVTRKL